MAEQVISAQIVDLVAVTTLSGKQKWNLVTADGQEYGLFDANLAQAVQARKGQQANLTVEQRGKWWNFRGFAENGAAAQAATTLTGVAPAATATQQLPTTSGVPVARGGMDAETVKRITRLSAVATAFGYAGATGLDEDAAFDLARQVVRFAFTGQTSDPDLNNIPAAATVTQAEGEKPPWE